MPDTCEETTAVQVEKVCVSGTWFDYETREFICERPDGGKYIEWRRDEEGVNTGDPCTSGSITSTPLDFFQVSGTGSVQRLTLYTFVGVQPGVGDSRWTNWVDV